MRLAEGRQCGAFGRLPSRGSWMRDRRSSGPLPRSNNRQRSLRQRVENLRYSPKEICCFANFNKLRRSEIEQSGAVRIGGFQQEFEPRRNGNLQITARKSPRKIAFVGAAKVSCSAARTNHLAGRTPIRASAIRQPRPVAIAKTGFKSTSPISGTSSTNRDSRKSKSWIAGISAGGRPR